MTFWAFGDSFMSYDFNYIRQMANSCNINQVHALGVPGSGLLFTYQQLLANKDKILKDDVVLIGLSSPCRHMFGGQRNLRLESLGMEQKDLKKLNLDVMSSADWHVMLGGVSPSKTATKEQIDAGIKYFKYLYSDSHAGDLAHAVVSSIFHNVIPSLRTQRVSAVITTDTDGYTNRFNIPNGLFEDLSLFNIIESYLIERKGFAKEDRRAMMEQASGKNHWLEYEDYPEYFYSKIPRVLDELGIKEIDYSSSLI